MNEADTRAELIDPLLTAAGWGMVDGSRIRREFSMTPGRIEGGGRRGKPLTADYVLIYRKTSWRSWGPSPTPHPSPKGWLRPRTTPANCNCASPTPATADKGFGSEQLSEMQTIISAEDSDLFDVLAHVAYALPPVPREWRAQQACRSWPRKNWRHCRPGATRRNRDVVCRVSALLIRA